MLKLIGSIFIIVSFTLYGIIKTLSLKKRCESLKLLIRCTNYIGTEILYSKKRCEVILSEASRSFSLPFLKDASESVRKHGIDAAFRMSLENSYYAMSLKDSDIGIVCGITSLFRSNEDTKRCTSAVVKLLELALNDADTVYTKNERLLKSGCILCGILICILLL